MNSEELKELGMEILGGKQTAEQSTEQSAKELTENSAKKPAKKPIVITIYVPLCSESCTFCDRLRVPSTIRTVARYRNALLEEIDSVAPEMKEFEVQAVRFVGGIPMLLGGINIADVLFKLRKRLSFAENAEVTAETVVGKLDEHNLRLFKRIGVTRLEFNVPTFVQSEHARLKCPGKHGGIHEHNSMRRCLGPDNWGINLMYGLPGQTCDTWERSLRKTIELAPRHVSMVPCSQLVSESAGACDDADMPSIKELYDFRCMAAAALKAAGYSEYAAGSFALPESECLHTKLLCEGVDQLGLGAGSYSRYDGFSYRNTGDVERYMCHSAEAQYVACDICTIDERAQLLIAAVGGLSRAQGFNAAECTHEGLRRVLAELLDEEFVETTDDGAYKLTDEGVLLKAFVSLRIESALY